MKTVKKDSEQAVLDKACVTILQNDNSTSRQKERAFNELYTRHNQQVKFYLLNRLKKVDIAENLLIITFQKIHENIASYNNNYAFSTWLYKIANNTFIDYTRKVNIEAISLDALNKKTSKDNDVMYFQIKSNDENPEEIVVKSELVLEIQNAINSLESENIKDLMICRYIKELSYKEIAEELGLVNNSTMRTSIRRGKNALKKKLAHLKEFI